MRIIARQRDYRLPAGQAIAVIAGLSALSWSVVIALILEIRIVL